MDTAEKPQLNKGDKILVAVNEHDDMRMIYEGSVVSVRGSDDFVYERQHKDDGSTGQYTRDFRSEGISWCRGWTGKAARDLRASVTKSIHQRAQAKAAEQKKYEDARVEALRAAARIVARAKLPRELRAAAFQIACVGSWRPFGFMR